MVEDIEGEDAWGVGLYGFDSDITLLDASFSNNMATEYTSGYAGGAIYVEQVNLTIEQGFFEAHQYFS